MYMSLYYMRGHLINKTMRRRYGITQPSPPHTILPVINGVSAPSKIKRVLRRLLVCVLLFACGIYGGTIVYAKYTMTVPYVTLDAPSADYMARLRPSRPVMRNELVQERIVMEKMSDIQADLESAAEIYGIDCLTASMVNKPYQWLVMKENDFKFLHLINPRIIWRAPSMSRVEETSILFTDPIPVNVTRHHTVRVKYLTLKGGESIIELEGIAAHCVQSATVDLFKGYTLYNQYEENEDK